MGRRRLGWAWLVEGRPCPPQRHEPRSGGDGRLSGLSGGAMTGPLTVLAPTIALQAATSSTSTICGERQPGHQRQLHRQPAGYVTNTALAAAAYGHDRWKAGTWMHLHLHLFSSGYAHMHHRWHADPGHRGGDDRERRLHALMDGNHQARVYQGSPTGSYGASPITAWRCPRGQHHN